ncbi:MAG: hypothetical protein IJU65_01125, partial [Desulfovibrio sp.]|nr:hypothetical protein [Desulfovibrio sp.]
FPFFLALRFFMAAVFFISVSSGCAPRLHAGPCISCTMPGWERQGKRALFPRNNFVYAADLFASITVTDITTTPRNILHA